MNRLFFIFFLILIPFNSFSQKINSQKFQEIEKLVHENKFEEAKLKIKQLEKIAGISIINLSRIHQYKVGISQREKDEKKEIELMEQYVYESNYDSVFFQNQNARHFHCQNDTNQVYLNKSIFSKKLAQIYLAKKDYQKALDFLEIHESKYLYPHPCGVGRRTDNLQRIIMSGKINQNLGYHKMVYKKLFPLTFSHSGLNIKDFKSEIDSILLSSLYFEYNEQQIYNEFQRCLNSIPDEKSENNLNQFTEISIFDVTFKIQTIKRLQYLAEKEKSVIYLTDQEERDRIKTEIYKESYKRAFLENRIYKLIAQ